MRITEKQFFTEGKKYKEKDSVLDLIWSISNGEIFNQYGENMVDEYPLLDILNLEFIEVE